jgi:hypothetical protein
VRFDGKIQISSGYRVLSFQAAILDALYACLKYLE